MCLMIMCISLSAVVVRKWSQIKVCHFFKYLSVASASMSHSVLFQFKEKLVAFNHLSFVLKQKRRTQIIQGDYCLCLLKMDDFWMEAGVVEASHQYKQSYSSAQYLCAF